MVKATFDVAFQHPLRGNFTAECGEDVFTSVLCTPPFTEAKGFPVCGCFGYWVEGQRKVSAFSSDLLNGHHLSFARVDALLPSPAQILDQG